VAAAFYDETEVVTARELDGGDDVGRRTSSDGPHAWRRRPGIHPAKGLRQADLVTKKVGVFHFVKELRAGGSIRCTGAHLERRLYGEKSTADLTVEPFPQLG
jgi:hypothetical protein